MVDINSKSEKCEFGFGMPKTIKITVSQLVREKFPDLLENLAEEEFLLLLDPTKAKKKFKLHSNIPFLLPEGELTENERKHYFSNLTINRRNGSRYVLTSQWYSDQRDCVLRWGLAHSCKELKPFVEKLEKETLRAKSSLFSDFRKKTPIEKNLRTVFEKVVQECEDAFSRKGSGVKFVVLYRGHESVSYKLVPSAFRLDGYFESEACHAAKKYFPNELNEKSEFEQLAILQHHGVPTRFLDVSLSPFVSLYFACQRGPGKNMDTDGCVLAFPAIELPSTHSLVQRLSKYAMLPKEKQDSIYTRLIAGKKVSGYSLEDFAMPIVVSPVTENIDFRIDAQEGKFIILPIRDCSAIEQGVLLKYVVPSTKKKEILKVLDSWGINEFSLFGDLDHLGKYLSSR
ncbi:MAG: FRG domain-containing protein [Candidatus Saccharibacteria bacterium]|nr:FRG domain-containing protein [Candidatus Saccharibacteria bacterium]